MIKEPCEKNSDECDGISMQAVPTKWLQTFVALPAESFLLDTTVALTRLSPWPFTF